MYRSTHVPVVALSLLFGATCSGPVLAAPAAAGICAAPKSAASARKNIAVGQVEGPKSAKIRLALLQRVKESPSFTVTDAEDLKPTASKLTIAKLCKSLQVDAVILGKVSRSSDLTLNVYKSDGRLVDQIKVRGGTPAKLERAVQNEFDVTIAPQLAEASGGKLVRSTGGQGAAPAAEEEEEPEAVDSGRARDEPPAEEPTKPSPAENPDEPPAAESAAASEPDKPDDATTGAKPGRTAFELDGGLRLYSRRFKYTGVLGSGVRNPALRRTVRPYNLDVAPALMLGGILYPGGFFTKGVASHIGVMGHVELGLATSTDYEQLQSNNTKVVTTLKTSYQAWDVGLRGRIPLGPAEVALFAEYGMQSFILRGDEGGTELAPLVPDVQYRYVRPGLEARVGLGKISFGGHFAPRILMSLHQIDLKGVWFPGAHGFGLDYGLWVGYGLTSFLDGVLGADFAGYGFNFNPLPTNPVDAPIAAGGATDYYDSLWIALRLRLGGKAN
jgi:hypothetical protein